jgi:hypothetical protein
MLPVSSDRKVLRPEADFYRLPENPAQSDQLDRQHIELFVQQAPDERTGAYDTLEAAIEAHEVEFGPAS